MDILITMLIFASGMMLSMMGEYIFSGAVLIALALYLYIWHYIKSGGRILDPAGLFSLSWIGGAGVSALKLSWLQTDWEPETWMAIWLMAAGFFLAYGFFDKAHGSFFRKRREGRKDKASQADIIIDSKGSRDYIGRGSKGSQGDVRGDREEPCAVIGRGRDIKREAFFTAIAIFTTMAVSLSAFIFEAVMLGYIPLFTVDTPHAYSYFHVTGVHYFTTAFVLVPSEAFVYMHISGASLRKLKPMDMGVLICTILSLVLPLLLVSRFQLIFALMLCGITALLIRGDDLRSLLRGKRKFYLLAMLISVILLYVFLTIERAHSVEYLRSIFEIRNEKLPIWIIQPYMYVANNFDNLNRLIRDLGQHSGGLRMLYPLIVFSGLKFIRPELCAFPIYVTKEELTTLTIAYDAYYDFGLTGVLLFGMVLGAFMALISRKFIAPGGTGGEEKEKEKGTKKRTFGLLYVLAAQPLFYVMLSFFTTWYSNPSTWFYLGVTVLTYAFVYICMRITDGKQ